jgi:two-component system OmpR family response regulator
MSTPPRILVVDDEAGIRFSLEEVLTGDGYQVRTVDSGEAALECIASETFDLAVIDLKMPGIGGIEVLAALRRQSPATVAIVLTAHGSLDTAVEALRQGAHDYLFKPCSMADLRESVHVALVKRQHEQRQRELLAELERTMAQNLQEIRAAVAPPPDGLPPVVPASRPEPRVNAARGLVVDATRHIITLEGQPLDLSPTEFNVLAYLAREAPRVVNAKELIHAVQGYNCDAYEARDLVRYHVYRIRRIAKCAAGRADVIVTVRGVGYTLGVAVTPA